MIDLVPCSRVITINHLLDRSETGSRYSQTSDSSSGITSIKNHAQELVRTPRNASPLPNDSFTSLNFILKDENYSINILDDTIRQTKHNYEKLRYFCRKPSNTDFQADQSGFSGTLPLITGDDVCSYLCGEEESGPYSLLSVHEGVGTSGKSHHCTTITIGKRKPSTVNSLTAWVSEPVSGDEKQPHQKTVKCSNWSQTEPEIPKMVDRNMPVSTREIGVSQLIFTEFMSCDSDDSVSETSLSCSSFSSAYTVTECEKTSSETSAYNTIYPFYLPMDNCLSYEPYSRNLPFIQSDFSRAANRESVDASCKLKNAGECVRYSRRPSLFMKGVNANEDLAFVFVCCEQRDRNEEEVWLCNDAVNYSCNISQCTSSGLNIPPRIPSPEPKLEQSDQQKRMGLRSPAVSCDERVSVDAASPSTGTMTTLMPLGVDVGLHRKHFTSRQRLVDTHTTVLQLSDAKPRVDSSKDDNERVKEVTEEIPILGTDRRPAKKLSSTTQGVKSSDISRSEEGGEEAKPEGGKISPSDEAILSRLSELKICSSSSSSPPCSIKAQSCPSSSQEPACGRCGHPVYPQELIKPTEELHFHNSCFKCSFCGLRLTLLTFCRGSSQAKSDPRVYCRMHTPTADGRPSYSNESAGLRNDQKEIVKCDSVGLRYF